MLPEQMRRSKVGTEVIAGNSASLSRVSDSKRKKPDAFHKATRTLVIFCRIADIPSNKEQEFIPLIFQNGEESHPARGQVTPVGINTCRAVGRGSRRSRSRCPIPIFPRAEPHCGNRRQILLRSLYSSTAISVAGQGSRLDDVFFEVHESAKALLSESSSSGLHWFLPGYPPAPSSTASIREARVSQESRQGQFCRK